MAGSEASNTKIIFFFLLWYALNVVYNDTNKTVLKVLDLPWTISALQLGLGLLYITPLWVTGLRKAPKLGFSDIMAITPVALIHAAGQCVTVASLGAGSIAFVNVVKSLEPFFNVVFGALLMNDVLPWQVRHAPHFYIRLEFCLLKLQNCAGLLSQTIG
eukprot:6214726-Pleurochrysis_carterae.AAC.6